MHFSQDRYLAAARFAAECHRDQTVPGTDGLPYLLHVSSVAMEVIVSLSVEPVDSPDLAVSCALLHDTIEDTAASFEALAEHFGPRVASGVLALTKDPEIVEKAGKAAAMTDTLERIRREPREVWRVKLADRITNLQPPPAHWTREKCERYREEAREILAALVPTSAFLAARLSDRIERYPLP